MKNFKASNFAVAILYVLDIGCLYLSCGIIVLMAILGVRFFYITTLSAEVVGHPRIGLLVVLMILVITSILVMIYTVKLYFEKKLSISSIVESFWDAFLVAVGFFLIGVHIFLLVAAITYDLYISALFLIGIEYAIWIISFLCNLDHFVEPSAEL